MATQSSFNSCLLNLYRGGADSLAWHSDNEPLYGPQPTIASVSFGTPRDFLLRRKDDRLQKHCWTLGCGDLLIMQGSTQQFWEHSVPKRRNVASARVNLTFRNVLLFEGVQ